MAASSAQTLVKSIREVIEDTPDSKFFVAVWPEEDGESDTGYLIGRDGKMIGLGDYHSGFSHLDELCAEDLSEVVARWARQDAASILRNIEGEGDVLDLEDLSGLICWGLGPDAERIEELLETKRVNVRELAQLALSVPGPVIRRANVLATHEFQVNDDVVTYELSKDAGALNWVPKVLYKAGSRVGGMQVGSEIVKIEVAPYMMLSFPLDRVSVLGAKQSRIRCCHYGR